MSSKPSSLESAMRRAAEEPAQAGLFGVEADASAVDALRRADGTLPPDVFRILRRTPPAARGPGRPKGAGNKRSEQLSRLIIHKYGDPVEAMASLYATPLDQLVELVLIADGTQERQRQLDELVSELARGVHDLVKASRGNVSAESINRLADACEALESAARRSQGKPGDVAIKALNVQLAAQKATAEYVHSKKPVEANVNVKSDGVLVFPGGVAGGFDQLDDRTRHAGALIQKALEGGQITSDMLANMTLRDGQLVDAEWDDVDDGDADSGGEA